ncbi:hypothetical protein [uncultured Arthrobacter sp.]|nr:hypothetical protein [uncultured Arthrobacter sp.]
MGRISDVGKAVVQIQHGGSLREALIAEGHGSGDAASDRFSGLGIGLTTS